MSEAIKYLTTWDRMAGGKPSLARFLLTYGHRFTAKLPCPLGREGQPRNCYGNAAMMVLDDPRRYAYVEGYATAVVPVEHAWIYDRYARAIIDTTWTHGGTAQVDPAEYIGIMVRSPHLRQYVYRRKRAGLIVVDPRHTFELATNARLRARALVLPEVPICR